MTVPLDHPSGLGPVLAQLRWGGDVTAGEVITVVGPAAHVGSGRAVPSSAARFQVPVDRQEDPFTVWVAAPAPVYLHAGQAVVLPTVRLFVNEADAPKYLTPAHWIADACQKWRFKRTDVGDATVAERAAELAPAAGLDLLASVVRFALFGSARQVRRHGLVFPRMPMWVRPAGDGAFARRVAAAQVVTARFDPAGGGAAIPRGTRAAAHRISPGLDHDRGLDPFHTPEGPEIRLTGRLGVGVTVSPDDRKLVAPAGGVALGPSSARLPFTGFNDPRRLLMAANMQAQAVPVAGAEAPAVMAPGEGPDPPGVNLRVGYLAWGGWNHEDAWVMSESAAARLTAVERADIVLERRALELDDSLKVIDGQPVRRGDQLIDRQYAPVLLTDELATLAALPDLDKAVAVTPEAGDVADDDGIVERIDNYDLLAPDGLPPGWVAADGLTARFRRVYRVGLRREMPLRVGDKLANRHGHKGVVGLVLPDDQMPRWQGAPLDALIDPVSVLNRSNWGQLQEAIAAGPDADRDAAGRSTVTLPDGREVRAVAGVQFVMRLPQHAADKLSGAPVRDPGREVRHRPQRFGEMDRWAMWAHGLTGGMGNDLSPEARRLAGLLGGAGYRFALDGQSVVVERWPLGIDPPPDFTPVALPGKGTLADVFDQLDADGPARALVFDEVIAVPRDTPAADKPRSFELAVEVPFVRWLPLIPADARPTRRAADGSEEPHPLTVGLRRLVRAIRRRDVDPAGPGYAIRRLMADAYAEAVGRTAAGADSSKGAWLRRGVLGRRVVPSGRAVVSPAGSLGLALDEIGVPPALAHTLFGREVSPDDVNGRTVWLKRDPVLHRWGLLPVRVRLVPGSTIRLSASLLGPLGADFDGDTVAVFAALPRGEPPADAHPPALAWDGDAKTGRTMFVPGKQYVYGLHLLRENSKRRTALDTELRAAGAPTWPTGSSVRAELETWVRLAATHTAPDGQWWAIVEQAATAALADDPGMGLGLLSLDELRRLPAVTCGASKDLYGPGAAGERMAGLLAGTGLAAYAGKKLDGVADPIAGVMVASKAAVGRFGGALRRLLYTLPRLTPELARSAQTLTEQVTQKALSVKAGDPPVSVAEFASELRRLLKGEFPPEIETALRSLSGETLLPAGETPLRTLLAQPRLRSVWEHLRKELGGEVPSWLSWLRNPHELRDLCKAGEVLTIPLTDARSAPLAP